MTTSNVQKQSLHPNHFSVAWGKYILLSVVILLLNVQFLITPLRVSWDYWPEWAPLSPSFIHIFSFVQCILFPLLGLTGLFIVADALIKIIAGVLNKKFPTEPLYLLLITISILISAIYIFPSRYEIVDYYVRERIIKKNNIPLNKDHSSQMALLAFAASRYDPVIDAIEEYHANHGVYPQNLDALAPDFLNSPPGIYMKYGERLIYSPVNSAQYIDYSPYIFELYGHYSLSVMHGITLKYCPVTIDPCYDEEEMTRINERWIRVYSSAL